MVYAGLRDRLDDTDPRVRLAGVDELNEAGAAEIAATLRARFINEPDLGVRRAMLSALGSFHDDGSGALILGVLRGPETDRRLRAEAIAAAQRVGGEEVAHAPEKLLRAEPRNVELRTAAVIALGHLRYATALPDLEAFAATAADETRQEVARRHRGRRRQRGTRQPRGRHPTGSVQRWRPT